MRKLTYGFVKKQFERDKYKLVTNNYLGCKQKLEYVCPKGHQHHISWSNWKAGQRCPCCFGNIRLEIGFIKSEFEKDGYELLTKNYVNNSQKLNYVCPNRHRHSISWNNWVNGKRCPHCMGRPIIIIDFIKKELCKENYKLLTVEYVNSHTKFHYICNNDHNNSISWTHWQQGVRCSKCGISGWENEVKIFIEKLGLFYTPNDRSMILNPNTKNNLELDIWMPQLNKAIECNGVYWHSHQERHLLDVIKEQLCKEKNIDLLVINDEEWNRDIERCKSKIVNFVK